MGLRFSCAHCSSDIIIEFLEVGERAECKVCKKKSIIPVNAVEIKSVNETRHQELQKRAKKLKESKDKENPNLICSACNFVQKHSTAKFCIKCGATLFPKKKIKVNECPNCKTHYDMSDNFCDKDGDKLMLIEIEVEEDDNPKISNISDEVKGRKMKKYIPWMPYLIWFAGKQQDAWDWIPGFFVAMAVNVALHFLIDTGDKD